MGELTLYLYPWDLLETGTEQLVEWAARGGVDRLAVATSYHSAEYLAPRARRDVYRTVEPNVAHLPLRPLAGDLSIRAGRLAVEHPALVERLATHAGRAGIGLTGWTVTLHNSELATSRPDAAVRNCFDDPSAHALCPTNPAVRQYGLELVSAVAATGYVDEIMAESLSFLLVPHGHPHELSGVSLDLVTRALLSLCFCVHCTGRGLDRGADAARLKAWVAETLRRRWNGPSLRAKTADVPSDGSDLLGLIWSVPDLQIWLSMRCDVVTELLGAASAAVSDLGVTLNPAGAGWAPPAALGMLEGIDVGRLRDLPGRTVLLPYHRLLADVARDLDYATSVSEASRFQVLQTLWPAHHPGGLDDLLGKIGLAQSAGFEQFGLYNYASATSVTLEWVEAVADQVHVRRP